MTHRIVLFAAGAGGDPSRYSTLVEAIRAAGFDVLAPVSERFSPQTVTTAQLIARVRELRQALAADSRHDVSVTVVGHSVGGWAALCLAGAQPWGTDGQPITVEVEPSVDRLVLLAPTVGWFRAPGALANVTVPVAVHTGSEDTLTPSHTASILRASPATVDITEHPLVGHFDFMSTLPPAVRPTPGLDRAAFLTELAATVTTQLTKPGTDQDRPV